VVAQVHLALQEQVVQAVHQEVLEQAEPHLIYVLHQTQQYRLLVILVLIILSLKVHREVQVGFILIHQKPLIIYPFQVQYLYNGMQ
jgi:hypothetical protein